MRLHQRKIIRDAVVAALTYRTAAADRVHPMRFVTYRGLELPVLGVYATEESVAAESRQSAPRYLERTLQVTIEAVVQYEIDKVEDTLDALAREVERSMHADPTFGGVCGDSVLSRTELEVMIEGERIVGVARFTYSTSYETPAIYDEDVTLVDLKTVDVKTSLGGTVAAGNQAEDKLEGLDT